MQKNSNNNKNTKIIYTLIVILFIFQVIQLSFISSALKGVDESIKNISTQWVTDRSDINKLNSRIDDIETNKNQ